MLHPVCSLPQRAGQDLLGGIISISSSSSIVEPVSPGCLLLARILGILGIRGSQQDFWGQGAPSQMLAHRAALASDQAHAGVSPASGKVRAEGCEAEWQSGAEEATQSLGHRSPSDNALARVKKQQPVSSVSLGAWLSF